MTSDVVLSYHDYVLRDMDIDILKNNKWLTDSIIGFYMQYLENEIYTDKKNLFISPEVTQCLKSCQGVDLSIFLDPLLPQKYALIYFPVNNNQDINSVGGSHWSLLIYYQDRSTYYHLDSSLNMNGKHAYKLARKLSIYFSNIDLKYQEVPSLQQDNSYDCGVYLLCNVENVANYWLKNKKLDSVPLANMTDVKEKRTNILKIINTLCKRHNTKI